MKTTICVIGILIVLFLVICFIGYKIGTTDQKYERDTGRDFASHRDRDFGGGYGGGFGGYGSGRGGYSGSPRTRSSDEEVGGEEEEFGSDMEIPDEPREPEF